MSKSRVKTDKYYATGKLKDKTRALITLNGVTVDLLGTSDSITYAATKRKTERTVNVLPITTNEEIEMLLKGENPFVNGDDGSPAKLHKAETAYFNKCFKKLPIVEPIESNEKVEDSKAVISLDNSGKKQKKNKDKNLAV